MARKKRKKGSKRRGHFCWCCGMTRPNEQFSGKGHKRHLCRECMRLGPEELQVQQALRNMEKCVSPRGRVFKRRRKEFDTYLQHENPRIRAAAEGLLKPYDDFVEDWCQPPWEYATYDSLAEARRVLAEEQRAINESLNEAAELDRSFYESDVFC